MNMPKGSTGTTPKGKRGTVANESNMLNDYYWSLKMETSTGEYNRQKNMKRVFKDDFFL